MVLWRRNLYILFGVQFLSLAGFSIVIPFLPLYIKELGVFTGGSIAFWSGMVFSSQAVAMMISAPIWGVIADRYGRKLMLVRASLGGAILLAAGLAIWFGLRSVFGATAVIYAVAALLALYIKRSNRVPAISPL